jgi:hypothetical protein
MGLDSYLYAVDEKDAVSDFECYENSNKIEFRYWRKHNYLHKWMRKLFIKKGGDIIVSGFNCEYVKVTLEDLRFLRDDLDWAEENIDYFCDIEFVEEAIIFLIQNPKKVFYFYSWY